MSRATWFDCGVPVEDCRGTHIPTQAGIRGRDYYKAHNTSEGARKCAKAHARRMSELHGTIYLPSKPSRLKSGKEGRYMAPPIRG